MLPEGINEKDIVKVDYRKYDDATQTIKPLVYKDGDSFCCLSGKDPEVGVFGCGDSPEEAIKDWREALSNELEQ